MCAEIFTEENYPHIFTIISNFMLNIKPGQTSHDNTINPRLLLKKTLNLSSNRSYYPRLIHLPVPLQTKPHKPLYLLPDPYLSTKFIVNWRFCIDSWGQLTFTPSLYSTLKVSSCTLTKGSGSSYMFYWYSGRNLPQRNFLPYASSSSIGWRKWNHNFWRNSSNTGMISWDIFLSLTSFYWILSSFSLWTSASIHSNQWNWYLPIFWIGSFQSFIDFLSNNTNPSGWHFLRTISSAQKIFIEFSFNIMEWRRLGDNYFADTSWYFSTFIFQSHHILH